MRLRRATQLLLLIALGLSLFLLTGCTKCRKGHSFDEGVYRAVCGDYGYTVYTCEKCEQVKVVKDETIYPHSYYLDYRTDPTCTQAEAFHYRCSVCGHQTTEYGEGRIPHTFVLLSHTDATCVAFEENRYYCTVCYEEETVYGKSYAPHHFSSEYTVDIPATTAPGEKSRHCTVEGCDARTDVTEIPAYEPDFPWVDT